MHAAGWTWCRWRDQVHVGLTKRNVGISDMISWKWSHCRPFRSCKIERLKGRKRNVCIHLINSKDSFCSHNWSSPLFKTNIYSVYRTNGETNKEIHTKLKDLKFYANWSCNFCLCGLSMALDAMKNTCTKHQHLLSFIDRDMAKTWNMHKFA